jgi:hypothetical protein
MTILLLVEAKDFPAVYRWINFLRSFQKMFLPQSTLAFQVTHIEQGKGITQWLRARFQGKRIVAQQKNKANWNNIQGLSSIFPE